MSNGRNVHVKPDRKPIRLLLAKFALVRWVRVRITHRFFSILAYLPLTWDLVVIMVCTIQRTIRFTGWITLVIPVSFTTLPRLSFGEHLVCVSPMLTSCLSTTQTTLIRFGSSSLQL